MFDDEMTEESEVVCDTHPLGTLLEVVLEMTIVVFLVVDVVVEVVVDEMVGWRRICGSCNE